MKLQGFTFGKEKCIVIEISTLKKDKIEEEPKVFQCSKNKRLFINALFETVK